MMRYEIFKIYFVSCFHTPAFVGLLNLQLVKEGVNQIGKLSEEESNRTGASVHGENRDAASEVSSDEEQSSKKAKKYNQPKDLLKIRSSTAFRKLRLETERINSTYRPADIDKVDWKKIARKFLPRMTPEDCKVRWCYHLDPNINRDPFTAEEKRKLSDLLRNPRNVSDVSTGGRKSMFLIPMCTSNAVMSMGTSRGGVRNQPSSV